jgi:nucleoside-diphosphate-sugar epimerase
MGEDNGKHSHASRRVLVTGSCGLIGKATVAGLKRLGFDPVGLDLRGTGKEQGDFRHSERLRETIASVDGVIQLAAVSRVIDGERDPAKCWATNVLAVSNLLDVMATMPAPPWLVFASSREVYGHTDGSPVSEDALLCPVNVYGESKVEGERLVMAARQRGLHTNIVRFSNVYGTTADHADRVIPAFARSAVVGQTLRVDGGVNTFDFTHLDDTVSGLLALSQKVAAAPGTHFPPIHFVTGASTSLAQLAALAIALGGDRARMVEAPSRSFDVGHFCGNPARAGALLGWTPKVSLRQGLAALIADFSRREGLAPVGALLRA